MRSEPSLLLVGGEQRPSAHFEAEWRSFRRAKVVRLDPSTGRAEVALVYRTPETLRADGKAAILFKAGSVAGDLLYLPTQTEVLSYRLPTLEPVGHFSAPFFNDVHHVCPTADGQLLVAVTGLDLVARMTVRGEVVALYNVLGEDPWARFDPAVDYRKVETTKPHRAHPNYVFELEGEPWATRFEQRDAICLTSSEARIEIGAGRPHDGVVHDGRIYFTTVDGHVVIADAATKRVVRDVDLNRLGDHPVLGWCRGLLVLDDARVVVGFSRLRPSRVRENLRWVRRRLAGQPAPTPRPTRVALYDLEAERLLWEHPVEEAGLNAIFSIHHDRPSDD